MARTDWQALGDALRRQPAPEREAYRQREARLLGAGLHPRTGLPLANNGETCGSCGHLRESPIPSAGRYYKCQLTRATWTGGRATDVLVRWPACSRWEPRREQEGA